MCLPIKHTDKKLMRKHTSTMCVKRSDWEVMDFVVTRDHQCTYPRMNSTLWWASYVLTIATHPHETHNRQESDIAAHKLVSREQVHYTKSWATEHILVICIKLFLLLLRCSLDSKCLKIQQGHATLAIIFTDEDLPSILSLSIAYTHRLRHGVSEYIHCYKERAGSLPYDYSSSSASTDSRNMVIIKSLVANLCAFKWFLHSCGFIFLFLAKEGKDGFICTKLSAEMSLILMNTIELNTMPIKIHFTLHWQLASWKTVAIINVMATRCLTTCKE